MSCWHVYHIVQARFAKRVQNITVVMMPVLAEPMKHKVLSDAVV
jgi:hypothetical protein